MAVHESEDLPRRIADLDGYDAYAVLGVDPRAGDDEITAAYRREMARAHPDLGGSAGRAQLVNCAFEVLTRHRDSYDELLAEHLRSQALDAADATGGLGVIYVEPDAEPLDEVPPGKRRSWAPRRVLAVLALVAAVAIAGIVVHNAQQAPDAAASGASAWTTSEARTVLPEDAGPPGTGTASGTSPGSASGAANGAPVSVPATGKPAGGSVTAPAASPVGAAGQPTAAASVVASASAPAAGGGHRCEIRADGSLWCAGPNARGQLGIGSTLPAATPVRVESVPGAWSAVAAGGTATCGLQRDGTLWCWGDNTFGQLGDGTTSYRDRPVPVQPPGHFLAVDLDTHACAVRADHTLWCWGAGRYGQLGDGGTADRATPVQLGHETTWAAVTVGPGWTCGVRQDGTGLCWGTARR